MSNEIFPVNSIITALIEGVSPITIEKNLESRITTLISLDSIIHAVLVPSPVITSIEVGTIDAYTWRMVFDKAVADIMPAASSFAVTGFIFASVSKVGSNEIEWISNQPAVNGVTYKGAYTHPQSNPLQGLDGNPVATISNVSVTNNVPGSAGPNGDCLGLILTVIDSDSIQLDWTNGSTDETGISIERGLDGVTFAEIIEVAAGVATYLNIGLDPSTLYYYRVRAVKSGVYSNYTTIESTTTLAVGPNGVAQNLSLTVISSSQINLVWIYSGSDSPVFSIERKLTTGGTFAEIHVTGAGELTYNNTGLDPGTSYTYRVRALLNAIYTAYSNEDVDTTQSAFDQYTIDFCARMGTQPSATLKTLINKTFVDLGTKKAKILAMVLPLHNSNDSLLNWMSASLNATLMNAPTHTAGYGWALNGNSQYLKSGFVPSVNGGTVFVLNSALFGVIFNTSTDKASYEMHGQWDSTQSKRIQIMKPNNFYNNYGVGINSTSVAAASTEKISGIYMGIRTAANSLKLLVNKIAKITSTQASAGLSDKEIFIGALNANGTTNYYENDSIAGYIIAGGLSEVEANEINDIIQYYRDNVIAAL